MTSRDDALKGLSSTDAQSRLRAARYLALHAKAEDGPVLSLRLNEEVVPWIKRALERAIRRAHGEKDIKDSRPETEEREAPEQLVRELRAEAVEEVAGTIIHEFSAIIGPLRLRAAEEVPNYGESQTRKLLDQLVTLMGAVRDLKRVAAIPNYTQFDLADLVADRIEHTQLRAIADVQLGGTKPFMVEADRERLSFALTNGLRNAAEAVAGYSRVTPPRIIINWGNAGPEVFLAVLDSGPGFQGNPATALKLGTTSKEGHIGFGLATAQQAMQSMEGDIYLSNSADGGARYEVRWYKSYADSVR